MLDDFETDPRTAATVARIAARNRFGPDADLDDPAIASWMRDYARGWAEGAVRVRTGLDQIMREPNAWAHRRFVLAAFCDAGVSEDTIITILRAIPERSSPCAG